MYCSLGANDHGFFFMTLLSVVCKGKREKQVVGGGGTEGERFIFILL